MTNVLVLSFVNVRTLAAFIFLACALMFPAPAHAASSSLTEAQIEAVIGLLRAFDVPEATVANVNAVLHNETPSVSVTNNDEDGSIELITPNSATKEIKIGSTYTVAWKATNLPSNAFLEFYLVTNSGKTYMIPQVGAMATPAQGVYFWQATGPVCAEVSYYWSCYATLSPDEYTLVIKAFTKTNSKGQPDGVVAEVKSDKFILSGKAVGLDTAKIDYFKTTEESLDPNGKATLSWNVTNAEFGYCQIVSYDSSGKTLNTVNVLPKGEMNATLMVTEKFTLKCTASYKDGYPVTTKSLTIKVSPILPLPTCNLYTEGKSSYGYGDSIKLYWITSNATYATWVPDTSGKDNIAVTGDKLGTSGSQTFFANVMGNPTITMKVYNTSGSGTCSINIPMGNGQEMGANKINIFEGITKIMMYPFNLATDGLADMLATVLLAN